MTEQAPSPQVGFTEPFLLSLGRVQREWATLIWDVSHLAHRMSVAATDGPPNPEHLSGLARMTGGQIAQRFGDAASVLTGSAGEEGRRLASVVRRCNAERNEVLHALPWRDGLARRQPDGTFRYFTEPRHLDAVCAEFAETRRGVSAFMASEFPDPYRRT